MGSFPKTNVLREALVLVWDGKFCGLMRVEAVAVEERQPGQGSQGAVV